MDIRQLHPWEVSLEEARDIQSRLASQVSQFDAISEQPRYVAGTDISPPDPNGVAWGAAVVMSLPDLRVVEVKRAQGKPGFPYIPGFLSFREAPLVLSALEQLVTTPDFILADGQGLAHPRRFGLACHLGLFADTPTIGCAKSILRGRHGPLDQERGAWAALEDKGDMVGAALRTREGVSPIYVSVGHKVDLPSALRRVLACCAGYRMPEPTRLAHQAAAGRLEEREPEQTPAGAYQAAFF
ncbi:MAG: deoxyribonuclease V [Chloroflexi bacterium]|nr:deoxyribonuclease V [Chloroflexota bacterium]MCZ6891224.1 deoxyribonuclease V [Chloroflexota bacterium]